MDIENLIGENIVDVFCEKFSDNSTGFSIVILKFENYYLEFTVEDRTDEILACVKLDVDEKNLFTPPWVDSLKNKKLFQFWGIENDKRYSDLLCLGINELVPTITLCTIASEIKIGFVNYQKDLRGNNIF